MFLVLIAGTQWVDSAKAELESYVDFYHITAQFHQWPTQVNDDTTGAALNAGFDDLAGFVSFSDDKKGKQCISKCTLIKQGFQLFSGAKSSMQEVVDELHTYEYLSEIRSRADTYRVDVISPCKHLERSEQDSIRSQLLPALKMQGKVELRAPPDTVLAVILDCSRSPRRIWFGVEFDTWRWMHSALTLKSRPYLGPTSLSPEVALLLSSLGQVTRSSLVLDPFFGTGSIALAIQMLGGFPIGSDVDSRVFLGKQGRTPLSNTNYYSFPRSEMLLSDVSYSPLSHSPVARNFFDAVITDPPYKIRASIKSQQEDVSEEEENELESDNNSINFDLFDLAASCLRINGRLVFLYPCTLDYSSEQIPQHPCFTLVSDTEQYLSKFLSRRVICMRKCREYDLSQRDDYYSIMKKGAVTAGIHKKSLKERMYALYDRWFEDNVGKEDELKHYVTHYDEYVAHQLSIGQPVVSKVQLKEILKRIQGQKAFREKIASRNSQENEPEEVDDTTLKASSRKEKKVESNKKRVLLGVGNQKFGAASPDVQVAPVKPLTEDMVSKIANRFKH
jgi:tRNA (guanine10-N2)-methyltransferase